MYGGGGRVELGWFQEEPSRVSPEKIPALRAPGQGHSKCQASDGQSLATPKNKKERRQMLSDHSGRKGPEYTEPIVHRKESGFYSK